MGSLTRPFNDVLAIVMEMMKEMMVVKMIVMKEVDDDGCEAVGSGVIGQLLRGWTGRYDGDV